MKEQSIGLREFYIHKSKDGKSVKLPLTHSNMGFLTAIAKLNDIKENNGEAHEQFVLFTDVYEKVMQLQLSGTEGKKLIEQLSVDEFFEMLAALTRYSQKVLQKKTALAKSKSIQNQ